MTAEVDRILAAGVCVFLVALLAMLAHDGRRKR